MLKKKFGLMLISLSIVQSLAQFAGPALFTATINQEESKDCNLNGVTYIISGCALSHFVGIAAAYNTVASVIMIVSYYFVVKKLKESSSDVAFNPINLV